jgi:hypothetical protein
MMDKLIHIHMQVAGMRAHDDAALPIVLSAVST